MNRSLLVFVVLTALLAAGLASWLLQEDVTPDHAREESVVVPDEGGGTKSGARRDIARVARDWGTTGDYLIQGTVVDAKGKPLPGIDVELVRSDRSWEGTGYRHQQQATAQSIALLQDALARGTYLMEVSVGRSVSTNRGALNSGWIAPSVTRYTHGPTRLAPEVRHGLTSRRPGW